jgi:hypothetical protein
MADPIIPPLNLDILAGIGGNVPSPPVSEVKASDLAEIGTAKMAATDKAAAAKRILLGGDDTLKTYAVAQENGNNLAKDRDYQNLRRMNFGQLAQTYGSDVARMSPAVRDAAVDVAKAQELPRDPQEIAWDAAVGALDGVQGSGMGIAALGASVLGQTPLGYAGNFDDLALKLSDWSGQASGYLQEQKSEQLRANAEISGIRDQLNQADNAAQADREMAALEPGDTLGALAVAGKRVFRDAADAVGNVVTDPKAFGDITATGIGSLIPSVGAAKAAKWAAQGGSELMQKMAVPLAVGATEAGGTYTQTVRQVLDMTEQELMEGSAIYAELRQLGKTHEEAQATTANMTGLLSAGITLPFAMAGGKLAEKFEVAPLSSGSILEGLSNIGKETLEEGLQGLSSQFSGNLAVKALADTDQDLVEGVGLAAGQGLAGGFGMSGALQGPGTAVRTTVEATTGAAKAVAKPILAATARKAEEGSTTNAAAVETAAAELTAMPAVIDSALEAVQAAEPAPEPEPASVQENAAPAEPTVADKAVESRNRLNTALNTSTEEQGKLPAVLRDLVDNYGVSPDSRGELLRQAVNQLDNDPDLKGAPREELALWTYENVRKLEAALDEDLSIFGDNAGPIRDAIAKSIETIQGNKSIKALIEESQQAVMAPLADTETVTPEVVQRTATVAMANPIGVDPAVAERVLNQVDEGTFELPDSTVGAIRAASEFRALADEHAERRASMVASTGGKIPAALRNAVDMVREDLTNGEDADGAKAKNDQYSLNRYVSDITSAIASGNRAQLSRRLSTLQRFAQHYSNKVEALRASAQITDGSANKVAYDGWTGRRWKKASSPKAFQAYLNPKSASSVFLARAIADEAQLLRDTFNSLLKQAGGKVLDAETGQALSSFGSLAPLDVAQPSVPQANKDQNVEEKPQPAVVERTPEPAVEAVDQAEGETPEGRDAEGEDQARGAEEGSQEAARQDAGPQSDAAPAQQGEAARAEDGGAVDADIARRDDGGDDVRDPESQAQAEPFGTLRVGASGRNLVREWLKFDLERARLLSEESPLRSLIEALGNIVDFAKRNGLTYRVEDTMGSLLQNILQIEGKHLVDGIRKLVDYRQPAGKDGKQYPSIREQLIAKKEVELRMNGRIFNLLDSANRHFNPQLLESAAVAAIHWAMTAQGSIDADREDVARALNKPEGEVSTKLLRAWRNGMQATKAAESLGREIMEIWGATVKDEAPLNEARGISEQLAAEMIQLLDGRLLKIENVDLPDDGSGVPKQMTVVMPQVFPTETIEDEIRSLGPVKHILRDATVQPQEPEFFFDTKPPKVQEKQKRNPLGKISAKVRKAISRHQDVEFRRNEPFIEAVHAMGLDSYRRLMGWVSPDPLITNVNDMESIRGKNNSIDYAIDGMLRHDAKLHDHAAATGKAPNDVITHFDWYQGRNGRIMAKGITGQATKLMRQAFTPTRSILDLLDISKGDHDRFWATVAQALGVKTEMRFRRDAAAAAQSLTDGALAPAVETIRTWLQDPSQGISEDVLRDSFTNAKVAFSDVAFHALLAVARYQAAMERGDEAELSAFEHMLELEADGKTDGPINAIMHFISGMFTPEQLENMNRGGVFLGSIGRTLNQFYENGRRSDDLYKVAADGLQRGMRSTVAELQESLQNAPEWQKKGDNALGHLKALGRVLRFVAGNEQGISFNAEDRTITFGRGFLKNPVTISVYGSSIGGIAGKMAAALAEQLYADMSAALEFGQAQGDPKLGIESLDRYAEYPEIFDDLALLTTRRAVRRQTPEGVKWSSVPVLSNQEEGMSAEKHQAARNWVRTGIKVKPRSFTFSAREMGFLTANIQSLLGGALEQAVDTLMGETKETMDLIMAASQIQGHVYAEHFRKAVDKLLREKRAKGELTSKQYLSKADYDQVLRDLEPYAAVIESYDNDPGEAQHINLSAAESGESGEEFFSTLAGKFRGGATLPAPANVGVGAAPMLTISRGDAQMMINYFVDEAADLRVTQVYDGLNMPADAIEKVSELINKAHWNAMLDNPMQSVADSFADFMRRDMAGPIYRVETLPAMAGLARSLDAQDRTLRKRIGAPGFYAEAFMNALAAAWADIPAAEKGKMRALPEDLSTLPQNLQDALAGAIRGDIQALLGDGMRRLVGTLSQEATKIQARKNVFKRVALSDDHMASGETPYNQEGETPAEGETLVDFLERLREEELTALQSAKDKAAAKPVIERASTRLRNLARIYGEPVMGGKVHVLTPQQFVQLMRDAEMPAETRKLFDSVSGALGGFTYFVGSRPNLNAYRQELLAPHQRGGRGMDVQKGLTDLVNKQVFISNPSPETILHEAIHAALGNTVFDHFLGTKRLDPAAKTAVENLTKLTQEFMGLDFRGMATSKELQKLYPDAQRDAALLVQSEIAKHLANKTRSKEANLAAAVNEFMAWSLSNQNLAAVLSKTKAYSRLGQIVHQALKAIMTLLGMTTGQRDMLSQVRLNTEILLHVQANPDAAIMADPVISILAGDEGITPVLEYIDLNQATGVMDEQGLQERARSFYALLSGALAARKPGQGPVASTARSLVALAARRASTLFEANHFTMTPAGKLLFEQMQASFAAGIELDPVALVRAQQVYAHVMAQLSPETFLADPANTSQAELDRADLQYRALTGDFGFEGFPDGKNNLLASFLALSQVSQEMRDALAKITLPKLADFDTSSADALLNSAGRSMMDSLTSVASGTGLKSRNTQQALDTLVENLAMVRSEAYSKIEEHALGLIEKGNVKVSSLLEKAGDLAWDAVTKDKRLNPGSVKKLHKRLIHTAGTALGAVLSSSAGNAVAETLISAANVSRLPNVLTELLQEVVGVTDNNWGILQLVDRVRFHVQALRQDYREELPKLIASKFTRKLKKEELSRLFQGVGKTDIMSLGSSYAIRQISRFLSNDALLQAEIQHLEQDILGRQSRHGQTMLDKAEILAQFMVTGELDPAKGSLLRNAEAISKLLLEPGIPAGGLKSTPELVKAIDALTSLKAVAKLDQATRDTLKDLVDNQTEGMSYLLMQLGDARLKENQKTQDPRARLNGYKGFIPSERGEGTSLLVADESQQAALVRRGYVRVGSYEGEERRRMAYYFSTVGSRGTYQQGILQTVHKSFMGVNARTGLSTSGLTGGVIRGQELTDFLANRATGKNRSRFKEALMPVFDEDGQLYAYERHMKPEHIAKLNQSTDIGEMIGAWLGRQAEEELADQMNGMLLDKLQEDWERSKLDGTSAEYVDLSQRSSDRLFEDARQLVPFDVMAEAQKKFGADGFMVRKNLLNNVLGYRLPTVADLWTENTNVPAPVRKAFRDTVTTLFGLVGHGNDAYRYLVTAEKGWQLAISMAKNTIVVSSVVVPVTNLASNFIQLLVNGVSPIDIYKGMKTKLVEIEQFQRHQKQRISLRAEMARFRKNPEAMRRLNAQMKRLDDADHRMTIWPLIEAGAFSTISEGLTQVDDALTSGNWAKWLQSQAERIPAKLGTVGRYALVTRDTALFQGMARATQYGDFLARAVLYDHTTKRQGMDKTAALRLVNEEFVNYNFLPGRSRSYLESMGMTWFFAFKLRTMKVALRHLRERPLSVLLASGGMSQDIVDLPLVDIGLPVNDNMVSAVLNGQLDYMTGPDKLFGAHELNIWYNLLH